MRRLASSRRLAAALGLLGVSLLGTGTASANPTPLLPPYPATCNMNGRPVVAIQTVNVTIEGLPGSQLIGSCSSFFTTNPAFTCLNGSSINAWTNPKYGPFFILHNGWQGPQCTYGTWIFV